LRTLFNPETVFKLQHATRSGQYRVFKEYTQAVDDQSRRHATLRGLFELKEAATPVPLDEVEPVEAILRRFATGAMSYGSISREAHETLAIAMNRMGGKSNTGEGGEDPARYVPDANGDSRRSAIKQVASGRFGVTSEYLVNADDLQIKMAQGAKPGEGGQLPGGKVYPWIAKVRHSTPGVGLISPPPHHDIYSIEALAQLIHDLKNSNPRAHPREARGRGRRGHGGGRGGQGPLRRGADLRPRRWHRRLAADLAQARGRALGARPDRDPAGAGPQQAARPHRGAGRRAAQDRARRGDRRAAGRGGVGFSTAPLVVMGCIMMRVCHLNTCPVGVATQDPELRKRFTGRPEFVEHFFRYIAEEVRELMARLGFRTMEEMIGRVDRLDLRAAVDHWKARGLDLWGYHLLALPTNVITKKSCGKTN
jgi:glutamate synthase domain-containing protein 2